MKTDPILSANNISMTYANRSGINNISLELRRGEILGLLGPNGAGKTTTLKILSGMLAPDQGEVLINGKAYGTDNRGSRAHVGYLPEKPPLFGYSTVDEYLQYCASLHRLPATSGKERIEAVKQQCGLAAAGKRLIRTLSKGFRQRIGIAQAILHEPDLVLLDEPTDGLDPLQIIEIRKLIRELGQKQCVVVSSHILSEIEMCCSNALILNQGRTVFEGPLDQLSSDSKVDHLIVRFSTSVSHEQLAGIDGIEHVEHNENHTWILACQDRPRTTQNVMETAMRRDWGLIEIRQHEVPLEKLFEQLMHSRSGS